MGLNAHGIPIPIIYKNIFTLIPSLVTPLSFCITSKHSWKILFTSQLDSLCVYLIQCQTQKKIYFTPYVKVFSYMKIPKAKPNGDHMWCV